MKKQVLFVSLIIISLFIAFKSFSQSNHTQYVNTFIGTGGHGHTYPGASMPFGMVQLSPDTRIEGWDGCSGYHYSENTIYGFSHTHLSGTGCSDYGDILFMPVIGKPELRNYAWKSSFDHASETSHPGYYGVNLRSGIHAELTVTPRTGYHQYTYPSGSEPGIVIDLKHRDEVIDSYIRQVNDSTIEGFRRSKAWAADQYLYFVAVFSQPIQQMQISIDEKPVTIINKAKGRSIKSLVTFKTSEPNQIRVKVGISAVSCKGTLNNLVHENPGFTFDQVVKKADQAWENELGKLDAKGGTKEQKIIFYTSLYHAMLSPNLYMDIDGSYRGRDLKIHQAAGFDYYTVFSLWDTYRSTHPLFTLIEQKRTIDFIKTFITQFEQGGALPVWELSGNETGCMIGYHSVSVIADAYIKGIKGFDTIRALQAMMHSAELNHLGLEQYKKTGYISLENESESVSKTLEYAYDDWCIAQMAKKMGKEDVYKTYIERAQSYKNLFDPSTCFLNARINGGWFQPFNPTEVNYNYTEANAWQYTFTVTQDISGYISLLGGKEKLFEKLDQLFSTESQTTGREQDDISGLIGQYAHGNEPSHHMAYLYCFAGQPWKTQELVHKIMNELYSSKPDGLCGNEDCGQMSSWYVMSALGFYPVTPGNENYIIGTPLFDSLSVQLENGNKFNIYAKNLNSKNYFIQSASLNGAPLTRCWINQKEITEGGELQFIMGPKENTNWGSQEKDIAITSITDNIITPVPFIENKEFSFTDTISVKISDVIKDAIIYYSLDGSQPSFNSSVYTHPLKINKTTVVKALAISTGKRMSNIITAVFTKNSGNKSITIKNAYAPQYSAGGDNALIDLRVGTTDFRTGAWQGYEGVDLDVIIDLGYLQKIKTISITFLQDTRSWIFMPLKVEFYTSADKTNFKKAGIVYNTVPQERSEAVLEEFPLHIKTENVRFIHIIAQNMGTCPMWHPGAGKKCWIFADEITVE
jgi:predicted alpha-1,2-mannosidase